MQSETPVRCDIVLVGGGHAHVAVLKAFGMKPVPGVRLNLISPASMTPYSGMLPGYLAGHYTLAETHVDLRPLCRFADARFYRTAATGLDLDKGEVVCGAHPPIAFDYLSIDIGSTPSRMSIEGADRALAIKPVDRFLERWDEVERRIVDGGRPHHVAVIGAGAGGVEAALALEHRVDAALEKAGRSAADFGVSVLDLADAPLMTHAAGVRARMLNALGRAGIEFHGGHAVKAIAKGRIVRDGADDIACDTAVLITPASAAGWLGKTGLALDDNGFIQVGETLQSVTDVRVFAAGDTNAFGPRPLPKSGVYAVRQGPALAESLRRLVTGRPPKPYRPQRRTLALISMGGKRAVLSYGGVSAEGDWAWRFKDWIDRRWMRKYRELPEMAAEADGDPDFDPMRCGGCGAKVPADILKRALDKVPATKSDRTVLLGLDAPDDAAVIDPPPGKALVQTVDQFRAFVEDPYLFGRIAANHCLGDVYAMGAVPALALANVVLPYSTEAKMGQDLELLLAGALRTFDAAGVTLIGGHTGEGAELALGFTINGFIDKRAMLRKGGLKSGDALILSKPLGTGVLLAADMRHAAEGPWVDAAIATMLQSNRAAAEIARTHGARAATDVTGFGLIGHLAEMAGPARISVALELDAVPVLHGAPELFAAGFASSLQPANERSAGAAVEATGDPARLAVLHDPQTAGGLLIGVPPGKAEACLRDLVAAGYDRAAIIGRVDARRASDPMIRVA